MIVQKSSQPYRARTDGGCDATLHPSVECSGPIAAVAVKLHGRFVLCAAHVADLRG